MSVGDNAPRKQQRAPGMLFGSVSLGICAVMLAALNPAQPPPPPTAEYAPEAVQALREAPEEQTSDTGSAEGRGGGRLPPTPTPTQPPAAQKRGDKVIGDKPIDSKRVRRCVGSPPRQIEDPQSPPCVAYFDGPNGGATSKGVTGLDVRVAVPAEGGTGGGLTIGLLEKFFNNRFEFYGRKVTFKNKPCSGETPSQIKNCAKVIDALNVFASLSFQDAGGNGYFYYDELARRGVVSVGSHPDIRYESQYAQFAPYEWSYLPSLDKASKHVAELVCRQLADKKATHAGEAHLLDDRVFGLISNQYENAASPDMTVLVSALQSCGVQLEVQRQVKWADKWPHGDETSAQQAGNAMASMNLEGVTTVICICHTATTQQLTPAAEALGYEPEWIISTFLYQDENAFGSTQSQKQWRHAFGLSHWNKHIDPADQPWYAAIQEVDPEYDYEKNRFVYLGARYLYHQMLVMASGIQMAGPNLTPHTFQEGLWKSRFPNPDTNTFAGKVGFEDRDHTFIDDGAIIWWDPSGTDPWIGGQGAFCYVRRGQRMALGRYPAADETFALPCQR